MRQIATLALAALVVAATVAAAPVAATNANATDATHVATSTETYGTDDRTGGLELTDFRVDDRELSHDETFSFAATFEKTGDGPAKRPVELAIDGRDASVGTLVVEGDGAEMIDGNGWDCGITITIDDEGVTITIHCGMEAVDVFSAGTHRVGMGGHDPVTVEVTKSEVAGDGDGAHSGDLELVEYDAAARAADDGTSDEVRMNATFRGNGDRASTPLTATVDGQRYRLGELVADAKSGSVDFDPNDGTGPNAIDVDVECDVGYDGGFYVHCKITITFDSLADGDHDVGLNGETPVAVSVSVDDDDGRLTVREFAVEDRTVEAGESLELAATYDLAGNGSAEAPLYLRIDGDSVAAIKDIDVDCELLDTNDNGWYDAIHCKITITYGSLVGGDDDGSVDDGSHEVGGDDDGSVDDGSHEIGVDDLETTEIQVDGGANAVHDDAGKSIDDWPFPCFPGPGPTFPTGPTVPCPTPPLLA